jgi:hypothetical protein
VTQLRAAIRGLLTVLDREGQALLAARVRASLLRDDEYATVGKPVCDWDDRAAKDALVDALVTDALAALAALEGHPLGPVVTEKAELLALVAGQDVVQGEDGIFRIARKVVRDRVISTVDTQARHGHKSRARTFDGYKSHIAIDPESELISEVAITPGNAADRDVIDELLAPDTSAEQQQQVADGELDPLTVMGDSAYADGKTLERLAGDGHQVMAKVPPARNTTGGFAKDQFTIDLSAGTVTCPANQTVPITPVAAGGGRAAFGAACADCPLRAQCTKAKTGRVVNVHPQEQALQNARAAQQHPDWKDAYRLTRPIVERKISHLTRRPWGGRKARCRGSARNLTDLITRAGVLNLANLARKGLHIGPTGWATA